MGFHFKYDTSWFRGWLSERVQNLRAYARLPKRLSFPLKPRAGLSPRWRAGLMGFAFLAIAGFLAWGAQEAAYSEAFNDWEHHRIPSEKVWIHALGSRGLTSPSSPEILHKALRNLPSLLDAAGSAWMSPDSEWVVVFENPDQSVPQKLYCRSCRQPPPKWEPMGIGWSGFDQIMARLDSQPAPKLVKKALKFHDPREIQY